MCVAQGHMCTGMTYEHVYTCTCTCRKCRREGGVREEGGRREGGVREEGGRNEGGGREE